MSRKQKQKRVLHNALSSAQPADRQVLELQGRVDELSARTNAPSPPWYRQTNILVTTIGAVLSMTFGTISLVTQARERVSAKETQVRFDEKAKLEALRKNALDVAQIDAQLVEAQSSQLPSQSSYFMSIMLNARRQLLLDEVETIFRQLHETSPKASPEAALKNLIAWQMVSDGRAGEAKNIFESTAQPIIESQRIPAGSISMPVQVAMVSLAQLHMLRTEANRDFYDPAKGRMYWEEVLRRIGDSSLPDVVQRRAETYLKWANAEYMADTHPQGLPSVEAKVNILKRLDDSRRCFSQMMRGNSARESGLMQVFLAEQSIRKPRLDFFATESVITGRCSCNILSDPARQITGVAVWSGNAASTSFRVVLAEHKSGALIRSETGILTPITELLAIFDWVDVAPNGIPMGNGTTELSRVGTAACFRGEKFDAIAGQVVQVQFTFNLPESDSDETTTMDIGMRSR